MILELKDINKSYPEGDGNPNRVIIKSLSLSVDYNESISIVGPSGCGKTTLLNIIGTLDKPDSGNVLINGNDITKMTDDELSLIRSNDIGFIFQSHHLLPQISVIENVKLPTIARKDINDNFINDKAEELLIKVGLKAHINKLPSQLSGGEKQRVAIIRSLINDPNFVLADEPTGSLDKTRGDEIIELLQTLCVNENTSLVVVTHDADIASKMSRKFSFKKLDFIES